MRALVAQVQLFLKWFVSLWTVYFKCPDFGFVHFKLTFFNQEKAVFTSRFNQVLSPFFFRLWGSPPPFSKDSFFDDYSTPSFLEYDVAAEVEWSVIKYFLHFSDEAKGFFKLIDKQTRFIVVTCQTLNLNYIEFVAYSYIGNQWVFQVNLNVTTIVARELKSTVRLPDRVWLWILKPSDYAFDYHVSHLSCTYSLLIQLMSRKGGVKLWEHDWIELISHSCLPAQIDSYSACTAIKRFLSHVHELHHTCMCLYVQETPGAWGLLKCNSNIEVWRPILELNCDLSTSVGLHTLWWLFERKILVRLAKGVVLTGFLFL